MQILTCSPHAGGSTDTIAAIVAESVAARGVIPGIVPLRDHIIRPCTGCGFCTEHAGSCILDGNGDTAQHLLCSIRESDLTLLVIPVYFYGPPALFKGFIDRAQRYWIQAQHQIDGTPRQAMAILCAARTRGERLFEANLLILRCFLNVLGLCLYRPLLLRGIENPASILGNAKALSSLRRMGYTAALLAKRGLYA